MKKAPTKSEIKNEVLNWRSNDTVAIKRQVQKESIKNWNRYGLQNLILKAVKDFEEETYVTLPWNLHINGPYVDYSKNPRARVYNNLNVVETTARFYGWLQTITEIPGLVKFIAKTTSIKGVNSPHTALDLWKVAQKFPSPHKFSRHFYNVRRRANQILRPYGINASNWALASVITHGSKRVNKNAKKVAALTLRQLFNKKNNNGREFTDNEILMAFRGLKKLGGILEFNKLPAYITSWATVYCANNTYNNLLTAVDEAKKFIVKLTVWPEKKDFPNYTSVYVDVKNFKVVHNIIIENALTFDGDWLFIATRDTNERNMYVSSFSCKTRKAALTAVKYWKSKRDQDKKQKEIVEFFKHNNVAVHESDALAVNVCYYGIQKFIRQQKIKVDESVNGKFISSDVLLDYAKSKQTPGTEKFYIFKILNFVMKKFK